MLQYRCGDHPPPQPGGWNPGDPEPKPEHGKPDKPEDKPEQPANA